jgi:hypothetical protein
LTLAEVHSPDRIAGHGDPATLANHQEAVVIRGAARPDFVLRIPRGIILSEAGVVQWQNVSFPKWIILAFSTIYRNAK